MAKECLSSCPRIIAAKEELQHHLLDVFPLTAVAEAALSRFVEVCENSYDCPGLCEPTGFSEADLDRWAAGTRATEIMRMKSCTLEQS